MLAIFHIYGAPTGPLSPRPLSGSRITPGQVGPQAVLPNLGGTPSGLYIKAGPQACLYSWVDQEGAQIGRGCRVDFLVQGMLAIPQSWVGMSML